jgi:hypothetical protein
MYIDLDEFFHPADPARYEYLLRFDLVSHAKEPAVCLKGFYLSSTLQMAQLALPALSLGDNSFTYTDESGPGRKVKITHAWRECSSAEPPGRPAAAINPSNGGKVSGTKITFRWQPPAGGAPAADYELEVSEYQDMRWVLSPHFHKLISRTANRGTASYELPYRGLLNPDETYYWRVRARSREGVWGPWSKVFSFSAVAPAVPVNLTARFDRTTRMVTLGWEPGAEGTKPVRYHIYGSSERGFTASDVPYVYAGGLEGMKHSPPNLLLETKDAARSVTLPVELWRPYYRVVAIDAEGRESGVSEMAELVHPLILTRKLPEAKTATYYQTKVDVSASIGHLVSANENGKAYQMRYRAADELAFDLSGAPAGLSIDRKTGLIAGYLPPGAAGAYEMLVTVSDGRTGARDSLKLTLRVNAAGVGAGSQ